MEVLNIYRIKIAYPDELPVEHRGIIKDSTPIVHLARLLLKADLVRVRVELTERAGDVVSVDESLSDDDQLTNPILSIDVGCNISMVSVGGVISDWLKYIDREGFDSAAYAMRIETETKFSACSRSELVVERTPQLL